MRRGKHRKFARQKNQRNALYKALATALIEHGKIKTTVAKAKSLSQFADKLITQAKKENIASRRQVRESLGDKATARLFTEVAPKFKDRKGGYTKIFKIGRRLSDGAEMALVSFTE